MKLVKGIRNTTVLRLQANATTPNPQWLFRLTNDFTGEQKVFAADDESDYTEAYNLFQITESANEDLTHGVVSLSNSGQWTFEAFEMEESSPRNMNPDQALSTVKIEKVLVIDGSEGQANDFDEDDEKDTPVFDIE